MKLYLLFFIAMFFSCTAHKTYYYDSRHYLHLKLSLMKKGQQFRIINSRKELQPFGFEIKGVWRRISDSTLLLNADSNVYNRLSFPDSLIVNATNEFDWEKYKQYGNNYIFPFFRTDTLYEINSEKSVRLGKLFFKKKNSQFP